MDTDMIAYDSILIFEIDVVFRACCDSKTLLMISMAFRTIILYLFTDVISHDLHCKLEGCASGNDKAMSEVTQFMTEVTKVMTPVIWVTTEVIQVMTGSFVS